MNSTNLHIETQSQSSKTEIIGKPENETNNEHKNTTPWLIERLIIISKL